MKKLLFNSLQAVTLSALFTFTAFSLSNVQAQDYLFESTAPVASHKRKSSGVNFPTSEILSKNPTEQDFKKLTLSILYQPSVMDELSKVDKEALQYEALDSCKKDEVELDEVFHHTEGSEAIDILVYDPRYKEEINNAKKFKGVSVPWDPLYDPSMGSDTVDARMQDLARAMNPECLPARFRFVYLGSKRYQEIRYGKKAWELVVEK
ncbi:MAG TPA: hypothetical protein PKA63_02215 [Oligoflexia bacterium]|nr:hypothetical protein [Oligoflexia bacterium]HMP47466.1 hypothetical protein [Oligoflexia bacterium]